MQENVTLALVLAGSGLFSVAASVLDWNFFFNSRKARFMVTTLGRFGARVFYGGLGAVLVVGGAVFALK